MDKVLIVVDMQNDFLLDEGSLNLGHDTKDLRERMAEFVDKFEGRLYLTYDNHQEDDCEFETFPKHCIEHTNGHKLVNELKAVIRGKDFETLAKKSYTGGAITNLANELADNDIKEIHVVGVCTHICVHDIVATLVNHTKNFHGYIPQIIIHKDLIDDFNPEMAEFAVQRMQNLYGAKLV